MTQWAALFLLYLNLFVSFFPQYIPFDLQPLTLLQVVHSRIREVHELAAFVQILTWIYQQRLANLPQRMKRLGLLHSSFFTIRPLFPSIPDVCAEVHYSVIFRYKSSLHYFLFNLLVYTVLSYHGLDFRLQDSFSIYVPHSIPNLKLSIFIILFIKPPDERSSSRSSFSISVNKTNIESALEPFEGQKLP